MLEPEHHEQHDPPAFLSKYAKVLMLMPEDAQREQHEQLEQHEHLGFISLKTAPNKSRVRCLFPRCSSCSRSPACAQARACVVSNSATSLTRARVLVAPPPAPRPTNNKPARYIRTKYFSEVFCMDAKQVEAAQKIVHAVVRRKVVGVDHADARQTVLAEVVKAADKWNPEKSAWATYVQTIAQRRCIDIMRSQTRANVRRERLQEGLQQQTGRTIELSADSLATLTACLTPRQRDTIQLLYGEGLGTWAAARRLGVTPPRVTQLHAAATLRMVRNVAQRRR